ncbi:3-hydroxybutyryl-CoA dehydrogenase [Sporohalobacter salinus]|uniref:3-hydroxybutyryl-CoA dehydrogenase n=1 Tax=Sporohalobacter salinus TaxID=1494606 RepID=UPI00195F4CDD|nr:3-hydroxybutyryl-CoA dehydrogenase [Sporohalobacter salinus]MBM7622639.1 3-hydroxybutyryl-CoA dehydrogenase [Sporohalobacter salinus]
MKKIAVLGAGTMGSGIAQVIASNGYEVILQDIKDECLDKGLEIINKNLARNVEKERLTNEEKEEILDRIEVTTELEDMAEVDMVIEAIVEDMEIKKEVFSELDEVCKDSTILATNTSALSVTELATVTKRPDQVIGTHFFNPVPIMKLVELIKSITTSDKVFNQVEEFISNIGKEPVEVEEAPGFVVNRILIPMINEAIYLLQEGVANKEDIDKAMKLGANHPLGPLALADLIGLDVCLAIMETLKEELGEPKYRPCPLLRKKVRAGQLGRKVDIGFYDYN